MGAFCSAVALPYEPCEYDAATADMLYVDQLALWEIEQDISVRGTTQKTAEFYHLPTRAWIEQRGAPLVALPFFGDVSQAQGKRRTVWLLLRRKEPPEDASCVCRSAVVVDTPNYVRFATEIARRGVMKHYVWVAGSLDG